MQFFYSATNGSDTGSVVAAVVGNEATANLSDLLPATTYTVYGVVTATNGSTPQSSSTTFTTEGARTDHAAWYELPARTTADETITQTVYPASGSQRNYTMYYDKSTYTAYWVAYPLAKGHMGNGRSDKWQRNPGLAESEQINVWSSSYGVNLGATTSDGYDNSKEFYARGHQIPNADRNGSDELVVQTYYATNSTPQIQNKFNGGIWQQLESGVRNIAATTDTVYVVTGAYSPDRRQPRSDHLDHTEVGQQTMPRTELLLQSVVESPARRVEQSDVGHDDRFLDGTQGVLER